MKTRGNRLLRILDSVIGPIILFVLRFLPVARRHTHIRRRILVLTNSAMGDAVVLSGVLRETMQLTENADWYIAASPLVHEVFTLAGLHYRPMVLDFARLRRAVRSLRGVEADIVFDIGQWSRVSVILARLSGARTRIGFTRPWQGRRIGLTTCIRHKSDCHEIDNFISLFSILNPAVGPDRKNSLPRISFPIDGSSSHPGRDEHQDMGPLIVLHLFPGGTSSWMKELEGEQSSGLIKALVSRGYRITLTGGRDDSLRAAKMVQAAAFPEKILSNACGMNLSDTAKLIRMAQAVISVNTGIMHLTAAIGTPLVAIHGPTNPLRWGPLGDNIRIRNIIPHNVCRGCLDLGGEYACHPGKNPPACMQSIQISTILAALKSLSVNEY